jgi:hypothetical protein
MSLKTGAKRHTHRYHNIAGRWHCSLPDCTHFMPGNVADNIVGKKSVCWDCGNEFLLDEISLAMDKPICAACNTESSTDKVADFLKEKGVL